MFAMYSPQTVLLEEQYENQPQGLFSSQFRIGRLPLLSFSVERGVRRFSECMLTILCNCSENSSDRSTAQPVKLTRIDKKTARSSSLISIWTGLFPLKNVNELRDVQVAGFLVFSLVSPVFLDGIDAGGLVGQRVTTNVGGGTSRETRRVLRALSQR